MQQQENEVKTMPQARQYESAAARQAAYRERQKQAQSAQLQAKSLPPLPSLPTMPGQARWNALLKQAHWALAQVCQEMDEYAAARSENWQESQRGEAFDERLEVCRKFWQRSKNLPLFQKKSVKTLDGRPQLSCWPAVGT